MDHSTLKTDGSERGLPRRVVDDSLIFDHEDNGSSRYSVGNANTTLEIQDFFHPMVSIRDYQPGNPSSQGMALRPPAPRPRIYPKIDSHEEWMKRVMPNLQSNDNGISNGDYSK